MKIGTGFAGGVGRTGMERRLFGKFPARPKRTINFVSGNLHKTLDPVAPRRDPAAHWSRLRWYERSFAVN